MSVIKSKKKMWVIIALLALLLAAVSYLTYSAIHPRTSSNLADDAAKPLKTSIENIGGIKFYENGDGGHGGDNQAPWYQVFYELPIPQDKAIEAVNKIAKTNGYNLKQATPQNPGPISVASEFLNKWYYDYSSVQSRYSDLKAGNVRLAFIVDGPGSTYSSGRNITANHSIVGIEIRLPDFKY